MGGNVAGRLIEDLLQDREEEDREKARQILLEAERSAQDPAQYEIFLTSIVPPLFYATSFETFRENMTDLMIDLRRGNLFLGSINVSLFKWADFLQPNARKTVHFKSWIYSFFT